MVARLPRPCSAPRPPWPSASMARCTSPTRPCIACAASTRAGTSAPSPGLVRRAPTQARVPVAMEASLPLRSSADPTACGSIRSDRSTSPTARAACVEIRADGTAVDDRRHQHLRHPQRDGRRGRQPVRRDAQPRLHHPGRPQHCTGERGGGHRNQRLQQQHRLTSACCCPGHEFRSMRLAACRSTWMATSCSPTPATA